MNRYENQMKYLINNNVKKIIKNTLEVDDNSLAEAYAAQIKKFDVVTDFLSEGNIQNHKELYKDYVEKFNLTSAKLDAVDKTAANSNHSMITICL